MSHLLKPKQTVVFDASNKEHRHYFNQFVKKHTWADCPVSFVVLDTNNRPYHNPINGMMEKINEHYLNSEFPTKTKRKSYYIPKKVREAKESQNGQTGETKANS